ncbi:nucleotidyltransferase domain-containing protein [Mesobacillus maritimus]|uniref:Nucleotidyltransferase domain-containing protein n=1 Tax=Mesobacillus maritimus TaxID=1643336 RepID=A0ABS7K2Y8_9BACI|nr:nucleotidyltransferase domain-containing protein [Mesobacillus maritimus]MBY0096609.1 nucleotidyltransferase domain-containing protein [Mesobacillus maritimus]
MEDWLEQIETEYEIEILFACEVGSRAWGYDSVSSDQDIRFIYKHRDTRKYFSLDLPLQVITVKSPYDAQGWDIQKAFHLQRKSNPNLFEWSFSPNVYKNKSEFQRKLQHIVETGYSSYSLGMHYLNLAKRIFKDTDINKFTNQEQKHLLYCLRSLMIVKGLTHSSTVSRQLIPTEENIKMIGSVSEQRVYLKLINAKRKDELIVAEDRKIAHSLIEQLICDYSSEISALAKGTNLTKPLNEWLWDILGLWGE